MTEGSDEMREKGRSMQPLYTPCSTTRPIEHQTYVHSLIYKHEQKIDSQGLHVANVNRQKKLVTPVYNYM